ncbi:MAG: hypothetical protein JJU00_07025 [Opitutales bacterium]|nr:hypothetical protein [Opitutales bacterium]
MLDWCERHLGRAWIAWHTLANLHCIGLKTAGKEEAELFVDEILEVFEVCPVDSSAARTARVLPLSDFEDALQVAAALKARVRYIVTRSKRDFRLSPVPAVTPAEFPAAVTNP